MLDFVSADTAHSTLHAPLPENHGIHCDALSNDLLVSFIPLVNHNAAIKQELVITSLTPDMNALENRFTSQFHPRIVYEN